MYDASLLRVVTYPVSVGYFVFRCPCMKQIVYEVARMCTSMKHSFYFSFQNGEDLVELGNSSVLCMFRLQAGNNDHLLINSFPFRRDPRNSLLFLLVASRSPRVGHVL